MEKEEEQNFILDFIKVYRSLPALWDRKSKDYANRDAKNAQYNILVAKYKECYPNANKATVVKKINCLRTAYRQYRKKVSDIERNGVGIDEESLPNLFYADALDFLNDTDNAKESQTSVASPNESQIPVASPMVAGASKRISKKKKMKKKTSDSYDPLLYIAAKTLLKPLDDQAKMCEAYAAKLRKMTPEQQLYADRFINEILFEGQLGNLHQDSIILRRSPASTPYSQNSRLFVDSDTFSTNI